MISPWLPVTPLDDGAFTTLRRRAIFDCDKWDPQVGDTCVIARHPLVITQEAWTDVSALAEALARETAAAEAELVERPDLQRGMGLWRALRTALARAATEGLPAGCARLMRFDFHFTRDGWRISEVNSDVPGGLNESSGFATLMRAHYPQWRPTGDPAGAYAQRVAAAAPADEAIALVHATAFSDDQQMMRSIGRRLQACGRTIHLASPAHVRWRGGMAHLAADWWQGPLGAVVRFFPAEWMTELPRPRDWSHWFSGSRTPLSNPATAVLTQHKRFPLIWDRLRTPLPTWRALLPDTRSPREVRWSGSDEWVLKPVLGRAGDGIGIAGVVAPREMRRIARQARWWPRNWVAQRRFDTVPVDAGPQAVFPCLGVYTLDGQVIGAYGRVARRPLIDASAADTAVLAA